MCILYPEVHTKTIKGENIGLTYKFSVHACEIAERERRRGPRAPWLGEMGDLGADKDSLWSAQILVGKLVPSILPPLPACPVGHRKVCCVGLPGAWEPFPGAHRGFVLCMLTFHPAHTTHISSDNSEKGCSVPAKSGHVCRAG